MIALQAVKRTLLLRALCGCWATFLLNPPADGLDRLEASAQTRARRENAADRARLRRAIELLHLPSPQTLALAGLQPEHQPDSAIRPFR